MKLYLIIIVVIHTCVATELCEGKQCILKCCPEGEGTYNSVCREHPVQRSFQNLTVYNKELEEVGHFGEIFKIKAGAFLDKEFKDYAHMYLETYKTYYLIENGSMFFKNYKLQTEVYDSNEFCIDNRFSNGDLTIWYKTRVPSSKRNHVILKWSFLGSSVFLFLVLVVYSLLPELRNLGGLILMAYVASLMLGFIFFFSIQIAGHHYSQITCLTLTSVTYFFLLASFCWLNVMSYDIWWTFRGCVKAQPIKRYGRKMKFLIYCMYAFGIPLGMTIALATLNDTNRKHHFSGIVPEIKLKGCFLGDKAIYVYLYAPMLIMILVNWLFFGLTALIIWRLSRGSDVLRAADSGAAGSAFAHKNNKQRLAVYLKLTVLMGLNWILEVLSSFYPRFAGWYITDMYNVLIGVVIFAIFVCKKEILRKLKKRFSLVKSSHIHPSSAQYKSRSTSSQNETHVERIQSS